MTSNRLEMIEEMLVKSPEDPFLNYAAALELKKAGHLDRAIELLERLLIIDPGYLATYYQLGKLLEESGQTDKAIGVYRQGKSLASEKNDMKANGELAEALLILGVDDFDL